MAESSVRVVFLGDSAGAVRAVNSLERSFGGLGRTAKLVTGAIGIGILGAFGAATKAAIGFDKSMRNVNSIAHLNEKQFKALEKSVLSMAKTSGQAPKVLADGLYDVVSSGFKAADAIKILRASSIAATAGMTDTATATKAIVAVLNAYHLSADKASNVSSLLFEEVNKGVNTFAELAQNIGDTAPVAAQLKIPFSQVAAGLALITLHGTSMAEASTQMSQVLVSLLKPSKDLSKTLHDMGFASGEAAIKSLGFTGVINKLSTAAKGSATQTADWFKNIRALRGMLNLTGPNVKLFNGFVRDLSKSYRNGGADIRAFNEQSKSIAVQWQKAKAALTAAAIPIGQMLFPALRSAAGAAQRFAEFLTNIGDARGFAGKLRAMAAGVRSFAAEIKTALSHALLGFNTTSLDHDTRQLVTTFHDGLLQQIEGLDWSQIGSKIASGITAGAGLAVAISDGIGRAFASVNWGAVANKAGPLLLAALLSMVGAVFDPMFWAHHIAGLLTIALLAIPVEGIAAKLGLRLLPALLRPFAGIGRLLIRVLGTTFAEAFRTVFPAAARELERGFRYLFPVVEKSAAQIERETVKGLRNLPALFGRVARECGLILGHELGLAVREAAQIVRSGASLIRGAISGWVGAARSLAARVISALLSVLAKLGDIILRPFVAAAAKIAGMAGVFAGVATGIGIAIVTNLVSALSGLGSAVAGAMQAAVHAVEAAVSAIIGAISRIPHDIAIHVHIPTPSIPHFHIPGTNIGHAAGGLIPLDAGPRGRDSVPAMLTPGEMVLNQAQQAALGGTAYLARMFGFSGGGIAGGTQFFAAGGIALGPRQAGFKPRRRHPGASPRARRGHRAGRTGNFDSRVAAMSARITGVDDDIEAKGREYSEMADKYSVDDRNLSFIGTNPDGSEYVDQAAVDQRSSEIQKLLAKDEELRALYQRKARLLAQMIALLIQAIRAAEARIKEEKRRIAADQKEIKALQAQIYQESLKKKVKTKVGKKTVTTGGPNQTLLKHWRHRLGELRHDLSGEKSLLSKDTSLLGHFQGDLVTGRHDLRFNAFDIRDNVNADEYRLRGELADIDPAALQHQVDVNNQNLTAGSGGGTGAGNPDLQALLAALTTQLAQANLALGVQGIQIPLIGAFAKGTINVPGTGLALVHAGERITPAGVPEGVGGDGGSIGDIEIVLRVDDPALRDLIRVEAVNASSDISVRQGQEVSRRVRGGRY